MVVDVEQVLLGQQLVEPGLVDPADQDGLFLPVPDNFGQGEGRGDDIQQGDGEESTDPSGIMQVADADDGGGQGDRERGYCLAEERGGGVGSQWSAHAAIFTRRHMPPDEYGYSFA